MRKQIEKDIISERIVQVIKTIYDPEIPVNIYDLGLIYPVGKKINHGMTFTLPAFQGANLVHIPALITIIYAYQSVGRRV